MFFRRKFDRFEVPVDSGHCLLVKQFVRQDDGPSRIVALKRDKASLSKTSCNLCTCPSYCSRWSTQNAVDSSVSCSCPVLFFRTIGSASFRGETCSQKPVLLSCCATLSGRPEPHKAVIGFVGSDWRSVLAGRPGRTRCHRNYVLLAAGFYNLAISFRLVTSKCGLPCEPSASFRANELVAAFLTSVFVILRASPPASPNTALISPGISFLLR